MPNCPRIMLAVPVLRRAKYEADPLFLAGEKDNWAVWQLAMLLFYQSTKRLKENSRNDSINTCLWIMPFLSDLCPIIALRLKKRLDSLTRACTSSTFFSLFEKGYMLHLPLLCDRICQNNRGWNGLSGIWLSYEKGVLRFSWYSNANFAQILSGSLPVKQSACVHNL